MPYFILDNDSAMRQSYCVPHTNFYPNPNPDHDPSRDPSNTNACRRLSGQNRRRWRRNWTLLTFDVHSFTILQTSPHKFQAVFPPSMGASLMSTRYQVWCVCVLHIKPFFLLVDIQHTQCPRCFFILERYKFCGHKTTIQEATWYSSPCRLFFQIFPSTKVHFSPGTYIPGST